MTAKKPPAELQPPAAVTPVIVPKAGRSNKKSTAPSGVASKPGKGGPKVCSDCGKKWARYDKDGLCANCAKEVDDLPPIRPEDLSDDPDAPVPTPQQVKRARIFEIAQLMASGEWRSSMAKTLAKAWSSPKWQVSVKTVQHYSAEASRLVDYTTGQRDKLVSIARLRLLEVLQQDENDRVPAARTLLEHMGELRQNIVLKQPDPFEGWTEDEITAYADKGEKPTRFGPTQRPSK